MRNIIKKENTSTYEVLVYNTVTKKEETVTITRIAFSEYLKLPENCIEISKELKEEKELTYKMTPSEFFEHATVVED